MADLFFSSCFPEMVMRALLNFVKIVCMPRQTSEASLDETLYTMVGKK